MDKKELKKQLEDVKTALTNNSKDARFAKKLISDLLSLKGQIDLEPSEGEDIGDVISELKGETFVLRKHEYGVSYHQYNSMDIKIKQNITSAYLFISTFIDTKDDYEKLSDEEKEAFNLTLSAMGYILSIPTYCFLDDAFFFDLAGMVVKFLREKTDEVFNAELKEETVEDLEKNELFKDAVLGMEELAESTKDSE